MSSKDLPAQTAGKRRRAGWLAVAVGTTLALLAAGCGTAREQDAGSGKAVAESDAAQVLATPLPLMTAPAGPTIVAGTAVAPGHLSAIDEPAATHAACRPQVYELILAVTPREDAGGARMTACLVLDLGDLSVRTVDLPAP
jgi:hypothetical protein